MEVGLFVLGVLIGHRPDLVPTGPLHRKDDAQEREANSRHAWRPCRTGQGVGHGAQRTRTADRAAARAAGRREARGAGRGEPAPSPARRRAGPGTWRPGSATLRRARDELGEAQGHAHRRPASTHDHGQPSPSPHRSYCRTGGEGRRPDPDQGHRQGTGRRSCMNSASPASISWPSCRLRRTASTRPSTSGRVEREHWIEQAPRLGGRQGPVSPAGAYAPVRCIWTE